VSFSTFPIDYVFCDAFYVQKQVGIRTSGPKVSRHIPSNGIWELWGTLGSSGKPWGALGSSGELGCLRGALGWLWAALTAQTCISIGNTMEFTEKLIFTNCFNYNFSNINNRFRTINYFKKLIKTKRTKQSRLQRSKLREWK
jgi:hypothetical protein